MADEEERLSDLDEAFLYMERPNQPMQIGCVAEIDGCFERDELIAALRERLAVIPRFRQRPAHSPLNLRGVRWEDDPGFDVEHHLRHVALPQPADQATLRHVVETLFATPLPPDRPLWEIHLIDGLPGRRSALLCKVHHCMIDGISALGVLERIADPPFATDGTTARDRDAGNDERASGHSARGRAERRGRAPLALPGTIGGILDRIRALAEPDNLFAAMRDVGSAVDAVASFVQEPVTPLPFHGPLGHGRRMIWRSFPFDEFDSLRVAGDCTINDAVLTVLSGALRGFIDEVGVCPDDAKVRLLVPVSVRADGTNGVDAGGQGNLVTAVFPWLPVDEEDPLERLAKVREEMRAIKGREMGRATGVLLGILGLLPSAVEAAALRLLPEVPLLSAACTNVRGPAEPLRLLGRRIAEIHPIMNLFQGVGLAFAVASYAGRLSICASTDPRLLPGGERLMNLVEEALYELRTEHWRNSAALKIARGIAERSGTIAPAVDHPTKPVAPLAARAAAALEAATSRATAGETAGSVRGRARDAGSRRPRPRVDVSLLADPELSFADDDADDVDDAVVDAELVEQGGPQRGAARSAVSFEEHEADRSGDAHCPPATRARAGAVRRTVG
ncbi:wax ester/triacylglycerol synthase family O-acyltransferase [Candidatus Binatia bacterium]|nr:wax ester/triacylglycerol synthase family O-acyltransferase [Candidatus Binatia bacterium]